jgi:hypothetical protein
VQDLEIYIRDLEPFQLSRWLGDHLDDLKLDDSDVGKTLKGQGFHDETRIGVSVYPAAFGKRYTCLILEGEALPWSSDLECGRSAWAAIEREIRCSCGEWQEGDPVEGEKWWRVDGRGENQVTWN